MEIAFKIAMSVVIIGACLVGLRWVWSSQIDVRGTVVKATESALSTPDWVATRDPNKIYQAGVAVGDVIGDADVGDTTVTFALITNTSGFDAAKPFEYQRLTLQVTAVDSYAGSRSDGLQGVYEGVVCRVIK